MVKKLSIICIVLLIFSVITMQQAVFADTSLESIVTGADNFLNAGASGADSNLTQASMKDFSNVVYNTLLIIGIVIAMIVGIILGVKLATAGAEEKAQVKETLVPYFVGVFILFGAFAIWKLVVTILQ